jgi:hypothetical protein
MNLTKLNVSIGTLITVIPLLAGAALWYDNRQDTAHEQLNEQAMAGDIELDLQRIELELKLLRTIQERRPLTPDEQDRKDYLESLREIIIAEQRKKVA